MARSVLDIVINFIKQKGAEKETVKGLAQIKNSIMNVQAAAGILIGAGAGLFMFLAKSSQMAAEAAKTQAKLDAVLKSTGGAAGMTSEEIVNLSMNLRKLTNVDDDLIKSSAAVMLTFTKIGREVFPDAMRTALDMSKVLGGDLQGSVIQVSKALNDFSGYTALKRAGVSFSEEQIKQIANFKRVNDLAGYQQLILDELAVEFGGVAQAMANSSDGSERLALAWGDFQESFGNQAWWKDFIRGVTYTVESTTSWIESLQKANEQAKRGKEAYADYARMLGLTTGELLRTGHGLERFTNEMERGAAMTKFYGGMLDENTTAIETNAAAIELDAEALQELSAAYQSMLGLTGKIASETQSFGEKQADLTTKMAENRAEAERLYPWQAEQLEELNGKYVEMQEQYDANAEAHRVAMGKIQYDLLLTKLSADGLTEAEFQIAQQAGLMFGIFDQESIEAARNMNLVAEAVADGRLKVEDMGRALEMLPSHKNIDVVLNAIANIPGSLPGFNPQAQAGGYGYQGAGYAAGGIATGPQSGYWELLHGTEAVIPLESGSIPVQMMGSGGQAGAGGDNIYINLTVSSPVTVMDQQNAQNVLLPFIVEGVRKARSQGAIR